MLPFACAVLDNSVLKMFKFNISFVNVFLIVLLLCQIVLSEEESKDNDDSGDDHLENNVFVLNKSNFDDFVSAKDTVLVEFYAPWCGHCKELAPKYEKAAKTLREQDPPIFLAKVDSTVESELSERFQISGFPALKIFKRGVQIDYDGPRDEEGIVDYMKAIGDPNYQPPRETTIVLTNENFTEITRTEELMVVMFYAPWCGHCKKMMPEYEKAAKELIANDPSVRLAKVDATQETGLASKYKVSGYPTMKLFRHGKDHPFNSEARDKWSIVSYIKGQIGPGSHVVTDLKQLKKLISSNDAFNTMVAFFDSPEDSAFQTYLEAANEKRDDYSFYHSFDGSLRDSLNVDAMSLVLFLTEKFQTKHEPKHRGLKIDDETTPEDIVEFIKKHQTPLVGEYNRLSRDKAYKEKRPLFLFFYTVDWSFEHREATQLWRRKFAEIAKKHPEMTFAVADDEENRESFNEFGFDDSGEEINMGIISGGERKFPMEPTEEFEPEDVCTFIKRFHDGKLKPRIKSRPVPNKQTGAVTVVVGKSFEKIVLDSKKDVLIELYAPWCGHCKSLEPIYKNLAKKMKNIKNLVIAKMDATANDSPPQYSASGFPTIYFAPSDKKDAPLLFGGDRTVEALTDFIKKHSVVSFQDEKMKEEL